MIVTLIKNSSIRNYFREVRVGATYHNVLYELTFGVAGKSTKTLIKRAQRNL